VAILEDDQLVEIYFQRQQEYSLAGSIHKGRVTRVLPGMQSAFVDIGLERDAFLYVSDFFEDNDEYEQVVGAVEDQVLRLEKGGGGERAADPEAPVAKVEEPRAASEPEAQVPVVSPAVERPAGERPPGGLFTGERSAQDRDGRDRRGGRRPRRRRGRGRGFPESKYSSPHAAVEQRPAMGEVAAPTVEREEEEAEDLPMLPGESISKYREAEPEPELDWKVEETEPEPEPEGVYTPRFEPEPEPEPVIAAAEPFIHAVTRHAEAEPVVETAPPEEIAEDRAEPDPAALALAPELRDETSEEAALEADAPEEEGLSAEEAAGAESRAEEIEPARIPQSLTAQLREQGGRYPHRVSRRMRRKMRGGEGRPEGGRPEGAPPNRVENREVSAPERPAPRQEQRGERPAQPSISDLLREGQEIIVQIAKEPLGQKGARITSYVALPGRFVVYMPTVDHVGVSRKIGSDEERMRLKRILQTHRVGIPGGFILRTAGEGRTEEELSADMHFLYNLWMDMRQKAEKKKAPALIHHDLDLVERILRDQLTSSFKNVWVDNEELYEDVLAFVQRFQPAMVSRVKMYTRQAPIFDAFNITSELEKALRPKVWLKTGGYIVINQTEALVAIDINTGKFVGKSNRLEDTIVKTNTDAVKEIVRQIRLRDLGGIIVVDFIDMDERKNRQKVMQALEEAMRADRAPNKILAFNDFGLVAITRKRVKQSLERTLCSPCPYCEGAGSVKSVATVIGEILTEAGKIARAVEGRDVVLRVNPEVAKVLKSHHNDHLAELEEILGRTVIVKSDPALHQEKFDLA
jgi:ribonuclease G